MLLSSKILPNVFNGFLDEKLSKMLNFDNFFPDITYPKVLSIIFEKFSYKIWVALLVCSFFIECFLNYHVIE